MVLALVFSGLVLEARAGLPGEIEAGFRESRVFEGDGSVVIRGVDEGVFLNYVGEHWRWMMDHPEEIPERTDSKEWGRMGNAWVLAQACEVLPPAEYVEFLGRWLDWYEQGVIPYVVAESGFHGWWRKAHFLEANSDDWRVRRVVKRMIAATPVEEVERREYLEEVLDGDYADHWEFCGGNVSDPRVPPETMPGSLPVFVFKHKLKWALLYALLGYAGWRFLKSAREAWRVWGRTPRRSRMRWGRAQPGRVG
ncbi:hypothetical protein llg_26770 [Luteolibacter sp. LG18]|nr:hypothetical protein llg_26770 [Luteolibacter sp. LG18]